MQSRIYAEFLAFFVINGNKRKTAKTQKIIENYCTEVVNNLDLQNLGAYLVTKCGFKADKIKHSEVDRQRIGLYNGLVKQAIQEIE